MSLIRLAQLHPDGAGAGQVPVFDGVKWAPGSATSGPSAYDETNLGVTSLDGAGNAVLTYTTFYGIDATTGVPYHDAAGPVAGEEAVMVIGLDGSINLVQPRG